MTTEQFWAAVNWLKTVPDPRAKLLASQAALVGDMREALWICVEHNALHFGERHNTVVQGRAALAGAAPAAQGDAALSTAAQPPADGALNTIAAMFHSGEEIEGPDGMAMMVDMSVWNDALDAFDEISEGEMEPAQPLYDGDERRHVLRRTI